MEFPKKNNQLIGNSGAENDQRSFQRLPAVKVLISDLIDGKYVNEEGWTPNYILTPKNKKVSRANVLGVIISKETLPSYENMIIDDGSSPISVRNFENGPKFGNLKVGDVVLIIGRPRLYGAELYILPEILKKQDNLKWIEVRKAELGFDNFSKKNKNHDNLAKSSKENEKEGAETSEKMDFMTDSEKILSVIRDLDSGEGAFFDDILKIYKKANGESIISELMRMGGIFEIKPGKIKVLE